ncbi:MAG TPA: SCO family protein [Burkholderiales bacterium]|nr:SCO family protein [Burkholderiales bacterium]
MLLLFLAGCGSASQAPSFRATDVTGTDLGKDFLLPDFNGVPRRLADFHGKVVVVFFGYTHCPDVCPTTLAELASAQQKLGPLSKKVQVLFITADPERDTPDVLKQYVTAFNPGFLGLRGTQEETLRTAKEFKVVIQKVPGADPNNYTVDHSAGSYIYDPQGRLRLYVSYGQSADIYSHDIAELLKAS